MSVVTRIRTSVEIEVPCAPDELWAVLAAPAAYPQWWPMRWPVRLLQEKPDLLGTEFEVRSRVGGSFCLRIEELHPPLAMRFRYFGGAYEGPGGFLLEPRGDLTQVRYDVDVFARGMTTAVLSQFLPLDMLQRLHMRSLLRRLSRRALKLRRLAAKARKEADRAAAHTARLAEEATEKTRRVAAEAEAARLAEEARREVEEEEARAAAATAARLAAEAESRRIAEEEATRVRAEEAARLAAAVEAERAAKEEAEGRAAEAEAQRIAELEMARRVAESRRIAEEEATRVRAEEAARLAAAVEAERAAKEEAERRVAEAEAQRIAELEMARRVAAEAEAARLAEEKRRREAEEMARAAAATAARLAAEVESRRIVEEEAARVRAEEAARLAAAVEAERAAKEQAERRAAEAEARRIAEEARRVAAEAEAVRLAEEKRRSDEAARLAEEARRHAAEEETARVRVAEESEAARLSAEQSGARPTAPPEGVFKAALRRLANWLASSRSAPESSPSQATRPESTMAGPGDEKFHNARLFLEALSSPSLPGEIRRFLGSEHLREEYAHRFLDRARSSDLDETLRIRAEHLEAFANQRFEIRDVASGGSQVAMELEWSAAVAADHPPFVKGQGLAARVAIFFKFEDGRIQRQRIYTCFEPWSDAVERAAVQAARAARPQTVSSPRPEVRPRPVGSNFEIARSYLAALSARAQADEIAAFFAEDAIQEELPNRVAPAGAVRTLADIRRARESALEHFASEDFELRGATGSGSLVALEISWSARVALTRGPFAAGQRLEAHIAVFLEFRDGFIVRQRNYNCFPSIDSATS